MPAEDREATFRAEVVSFDTLQRHIASYFEVFEAAYLKLLALSKMLTLEYQLYPEQCHEIHQFLWGIYQPLRTFCSLLDNSAKLPPEIVASCYSPLVALRNTLAQIKTLLPLSGGLSDAHFYTPRNRQKRQEDLKQHFSLLQRSYQIMQARSRALLEQVLTQAKQSELISQEQKRYLLLQSATSYQALGREACQQGCKEEAYACFQRALTLLRKIGQSREEASVLNNLGKVCRVLGKQDDACRYLEEALVLARKHEDHVEELRILSNLSLVYTDLSKKDRS